MLYKPPATSKSMVYGREMEAFARTIFKKLYQVSTKPYGLFIDRDYPYLAASPGTKILIIFNIFLYFQYTYTATHEYLKYQFF